MSDHKDPSEPQDAERPSADGPSVPAPAPAPSPWPKHGSRVGADYRIFRSRWDTLTNPRNGETMDRVVLETPDWVNVVAFDAAGDVIVIEQFRFGPGHNTIEIPGGMVDPGEDPAVAAARELREETGYTSERWFPLGSVNPNPAFHDNRCHHFLALDAAPTHPLEQDRGEDIVVRTMPRAELVDAIRTGRIEHALVLTAVSRVLDLRWPDVAREAERTP
ncbi:MAG: NUDIX hydrolase [Planctomycetota bacterium]